MARPRKFDSPRVTTAIRVPEDLHKRLQIEAEARDTSVNHLMVKAAAYYLDNVLRPIEASISPSMKEAG